MRRVSSVARLGATRVIKRECYWSVQFEFTAAMSHACRGHELAAKMLAVSPRSLGKHGIRAPDLGRERGQYELWVYVIMQKRVHNNPVRRGLVARAEQWPWSSARAWTNGDEQPLAIDRRSLPTLMPDRQ